MIEPTRTERAVLAAVEDFSEDIAETLVALVRIPTVNPYGGDPGARGEAEGQRFLERLLRAAGGRTEYLPVPADVYERAGMLGPRGRSFAGRDNLIGRFKFGSGAGPVVVLNGHMDTVGTAGFEGDPFSGRRDGDLIHGRGSGDCKGGLVAGLFALRALAEAGATLNGEIVFESVVEEECSGAGAGTLACCLAGVRGRAAILLDGAAGRIFTGCQGIATFEATVRGRSGHGSYGGVNAIEKLLVVKAAVDRFAAERAAAQPSQPVNVGVLQAGTAPWMVPDRGLLSANVNYGYAEAEQSQAAGRGFCGALVRGRFEQLLAEAAAADPWLREHLPELVWTKDVPPCRLEDAPAGAATGDLLAAARRGFELSWGRPGEEGELPAWYDGSHLVRVGRMPTVALGSAEPGTAHTATEFNRVSNVKRAAGAVALAVLRLLAK
jgi:acetylornithine deacetylase